MNRSVSGHPLTRDDMRNLASGLRAAVPLPKSNPQQQAVRGHAAGGRRRKVVPQLAFSSMRNARKGGASGRLSGTVGSCKKRFASPLLEGRPRRKTFGLMRVIDEDGGISRAVPIYIGLDEPGAVALRRADRLPFGGSDVSVSVAWASLDEPARNLLRTATVLLLNNMLLVIELSRLHPGYALGESVATAELEIVRYHNMLELARTQLGVEDISLPSVRRLAIDLFVRSRQASSNYGMQCSHIDQMKKGQPAMEWKVTAALGEQWFPVDLGDNGSLHPPLAGMLIYDAFRCGTMCSAALGAGDADFEVHHLTARNAWHRCGRALPDEWCQDYSSHARGAYVRSWSVVFLFGISLCDHPGVGTDEWWRTSARRQAARAGITLAQWAHQHGMHVPVALVPLGQAVIAPVVVAPVGVLAGPPPPPPQQPPQPPPPPAATASWRARMRQ